MNGAKITTIRKSVWRNRSKAGARKNGRLRERVRIIRLEKIKNTFGKTRNLNISLQED